jgi:hypothetical protein
MKNRCTIFSVLFLSISCFSRLLEYTRCECRKPHCVHLLIIFLRSFTVDNTIGGPAPFFQWECGEEFSRLIGQGPVCSHLNAQFIPSLRVAHLCVFSSRPLFSFQYRVPAKSYEHVKNNGRIDYFDIVTKASFRLHFSSPATCHSKTPCLRSFSLQGLASENNASTLKLFLSCDK